MSHHSHRHNMALITWLGPSTHRHTKHVDNENLFYHNTDAQTWMDRFQLGLFIVIVIRVTTTVCMWLQVCHLLQHHWKLLRLKGFIYLYIHACLSPLIICAFLHFFYTYLLLVLSSSDVIDGAWGSPASYSSGMDLQHQHMPQRVHHGKTKHVDFICLQLSIYSSMSVSLQK